MFHQVFLEWKNYKWKIENDKSFIGRYFAWLRKKYKFRSKWISQEIQTLVDTPSELVDGKVNIFNPIIRRYIEFLNKDSINLIDWIDIPYDATKDIPIVDQKPQLSLYFNLWNRKVYNNRFNNADLRYAQKIRIFEFAKPIFMWHKFNLIRTHQLWKHYRASSKFAKMRLKGRLRTYKFPPSRSKLFLLFKSQNIFKLLPNYIQAVQKKTRLMVRKRKIWKI